MKRYDVTVITWPREHPADGQLESARLRMIYRGLPSCGHDCPGYIVHQRISRNALVDSEPEPEPRDMDTPLRLDQDRLDVEEWRAQWS